MHCMPSWHLLIELWSFIMRALLGWFLLQRYRSSLPLEINSFRYRRTISVLAMVLWSSGRGLWLVDANHCSYAVMSTIKMSPVDATWDEPFLALHHDWFYTCIKGFLVRGLILTSDYESYDQAHNRKPSELRILLQIFGNNQLFEVILVFLQSDSSELTME